MKSKLSITSRHPRAFAAREQIRASVAVRPNGPCDCVRFMPPRKAQ